MTLNYVSAHGIFQMHFQKQPILTKRTFETIEDENFPNQKCFLQNQPLKTKVWYFHGNLGDVVAKGGTYAFESRNVIHASYTKRMNKYLLGIEQSDWK